MTYEVAIDHRALRELSDLPDQVRKRMIARIRALADDPRSVTTQQLQGRLRHLRKLRVGAYRAVYSVDDDIREVIVLAVGHRRDFYDAVARRL